VVLALRIVEGEEENGPQPQSRRPLSEKETQELEELRNPNVESLSSPEYLEMLKKDRFICNPLVRQAFGMTGGENFLVPREGTWKDRQYCPGASKTCCDHRSIAKVINYYRKAKQTFRDSWSVVVETLTLFQGKAFESFLRYNRNKIKDNCMYVLKETDGFKKSVSFDMLNPEQVQRHLLILEQLANELNSYLNNNEFIYGGLICTICSPKHNRYFWMNKNFPVFKISMSMCAKLVEMRLQEALAFKVFTRFIRPIARTINCLNDRDTDPDYALMDLRVGEIRKNSARAQACSADFDHENPECRAVCKINLFTYFFPSNIVECYKSALKIIFEEFARFPVEKYYAEVKMIAFEDLTMDQLHFLNPNTKEAVAVNMKDAKVDLRLKGMNIFYNHISVAGSIGWQRPVWALLVVAWVAFNCS
jgi:hypothetical protein